MQYLTVQAAIDLFSAENVAGYIATAVVAILGFLITWFLLKKLLYKPIMKITNARAEMVQAGMNANKEEEERLQALEKDIEERKAAFLKEEAQHKKEAAEQLEIEREDMMREAKAKADNIIEKAEKDAHKLQREQADKYRKDVIELSLQILGVVLQDDEAAQNKKEDISEMVSAMLAKKE